MRFQLCAVALVALAGCALAQTDADVLNFALQLVRSSLLLLSCVLLLTRAALSQQHREDHLLRSSP